MINKAQAEAIFNQYACLVKDRDIMPWSEAERFTSGDAVEFAIRQETCGETYNGYGIGEEGTMLYLTKLGFFLAVTYQNVKEELERNRD